MRAYTYLNAFLRFPVSARMRSARVPGYVGKIRQMTHLARFRKLKVRSWLVLGMLLSMGCAGGSSSSAVLPGSAAGGGNTSMGGSSSGGTSTLTGGQGGGTLAGSGGQPGSVTSGGTSGSASGSGGTGRAQPECQPVDDQKVIGCQGADRVICRFGKIDLGPCLDAGTSCIHIEETGVVGCFQCDPRTFVNRCEGTKAIYCTQNGRIKQQTCSECSAGCCNDGDGDNMRGCDGDCDDADPLVFKGQTSYFSNSSRSSFSFDFNCDGAYEPEYTSLYSRDNTCCNCWLQSSVPGCGQSADIRYCNGADAIATQSCR
ncbi:MAG: hypothetical protein SFV15_11100 [Polyangiaceae bacterium]|nr:hypothetical protein [Polyangiaceae bacterium]